MILSNELVLGLQVLVVACTSLVALRLGKSALVSFIVICLVLANLFVVKQTTLFGLQATTADSLVVGSLVGLNLLQEFFERSSVQKAIVATFLSLAFYAVIVPLHLAYLPSATDRVHEHFVKTVSVAPLLVLGSALVYSIAQVTNFLVYGILQKILPAWLVLRNYVTLICSQLVDTILFTLFLMVLGIVSNGADVILISFSIKLIVTIFAVPFVIVLARRLVGVREGASGDSI